MYPFFKRPPTIKYPGKMTQQSKSSFVSLKMEDPASNSGIISIYKVKFFKIIMKMKIFYSFIRVVSPICPQLAIVSKRRQCSETKVSTKEVLK